MATIKKRTDRTGRTTFHVRVRLKVQPVACASFDSKTRAKLWASETEREIREGRYFDKAEAKRHTLAEAIARFQKERPHRHLRSAHDMDTRLEWFEENYGRHFLADIT